MKAFPVMVGPWEGGNARALHVGSESSSTQGTQPLRARVPRETRGFRAGLILQVYEVEPLVCASCGGTMKVLGVLDQEAVIYCFLAHLNLQTSGDGPRAPSPRRPSPASASSTLAPSKSFTTRYHACASPSELGTRNGMGQVVRVGPADAS